MLQSLLQVGFGYLNTEPSRVLWQTLTRVISRGRVKPPLPQLWPAQASTGGRRHGKLPREMGAFVWFHAVDGSEIRRENQLMLVVYPIIYRVLYIPGGAGFSWFNRRCTSRWFKIDTLPETKSKSTPENGWLEYKPFLLGWVPGSYVSIREGIFEFFPPLKGLSRKSWFSIAKLVYWRVLGGSSQDLVKNHGDCKTCLPWIGL